MPTSDTTTSRPASLADWLTYLESVHPSAIELGLNRIKAVAATLNLQFADKTVFTVAGTNGKGTTCRFLEMACLAQGKSTGVYSSPHLLDYRERVRLNDTLPDEQAFCDAFTTIDAARGDISLTYFEFSTLAALLLMQQADVDVLILEVGLGGRLDATNIIDADIAVITTIDLDHQDWLGDTRDAIGREKAGIMRKHGKAVIGELDPPAGLLEVVTQLQVTARLAGQQFSMQGTAPWQWQGVTQTFSDLPVPAIPQQNIATALAALEMAGLLPDVSTVARLVAETQLPGRLQQIYSQPRTVVDVGHNPQAMRALRQWLSQQEYRQLHLVAGMLRDKSIADTLAQLNGLDAHWSLAATDGPRGATAEQLYAQLDNAEQKQATCYTSVQDAFEQAIDHAHADDLIVVFGSFVTVGAALNAVTPTQK